MKMGEDVTKYMHGASFTATQVDEIKWHKSTEKKPPFNEPVWGMFRGRDVEICKLALTPSEYQNYFDYAECSWFSLESEKCKSVTHWMPLIRPEKPT